mgnify:CR=1 FL=1|jgi:hypothetical protein|tara:strand:- start:54 stop:1463 length:1410 start_codon:yes stop_codon:yes gene_type:complete
MATKDMINSLLGKPTEGSSVAKLAASYFSGQSKNNNRLRNLMLGQVVFGAKETSMQNKVIKNLQANEDQRTFDLANVTSKWEKYNELMTADESFKADPFYFNDKAKDKYNKVWGDKGLNMNLQENKDFRTKEIEDYERALKTLHLEKIKTGNINKKLSKEQFFKPFEEYYSNRQEDIAAPKNLSIVHNAWNRLTQGKQKPVTEAEMATKRKTATRGAFDYLLDPSVVSKTEQIERERDTSTVTYSKEEAQRFIVDNMAATDPARGKALREFDFSNKKQWTENDLTLFTVTAQTDFNPILEKNRVVNAAFDSTWMQENNVQVTPKADSDEYLNYYLQKQNNLDEANGVGNPEDRQLRTNIFELENIKKSIENSKFANTPKEHPLYVVQQKLESDIKLAGVDKITFQMFNFVQAKLLDPIDGQIIRAQVRSEAKKAEGYDPEVSYEYETLNQYIGENVSDLMSGFEYILNK